MAVVLRCEEVHKAYDGRVLLDHATVAITGEHRWGVVGRNGCGKSTLVRMIMREEEPDSGDIWRHPDLRIGHLEQHDPFQEGESVCAFLERYGEQPDWRCAAIAARLGIANEQLDQPIRSLSGGFQTRAKLAGLLLRDPDFLVLDEPTNFLDLRTQMLLERFLRDWTGGALIVSHDRCFLRAVCDRTLAVEGGELIAHPAPVDDWIAHRAERAEQIARTNASILAKRKQLQRFIDKNRANANTASQARSKAKQLQRLETVAAVMDEAGVRLRVPEVPARKGPALRTADLQIGYPERRVATGIDLEVEHGSRVAVVGDNGQGKTTLVRTICGDLPALGGTLRWGHGCELGVYAQHVYTAIPGTETIVSYLQACGGPEVQRQEVLDVAGSFLFSGDDVLKPVHILSGGERARLCLAGLLLARPTVLLLDEPTNHLDVETVEALAEALCRYRGTVFVVSHERDFLARIATNVIEVQNGTVRHSPGSWEEYRYRMERELTDDGAARGSTTADPAVRPAAAVDGKRQHQLQKRATAAERKVAKLDQRRSRLQQELASSDPQHAQRVQADLEALEAEIATAEEDWFTAQEELAGA